MRGHTSSVLFATARLLFSAVLSLLDRIKLDRITQRQKWRNNSYTRSPPTPGENECSFCCLFPLARTHRKRNGRYWWKEQTSHAVLKMLGKWGWCRGVVLKCWCTLMAGLRESKVGSAQLTSTLVVCCVLWRWEAL